MTAKHEYQTLLYKEEASIAILTLNRPYKLNAINALMIEELNHALDLAENAEHIRAILLRGAGRAFSAGFDLEMEGAPPVSDVVAWREELRRGFDIIMRFWDCPKPTLAAVHAYCLGSAMEMAVACDITIAADDSRFGAPEVKFGSGIVAMILPWLIGVKAVKELLLSGDDNLGAERALALGLVNKVVEKQNLKSEALAMARTIAGNDHLAVKLTKQAINRSCEVMGMRTAMLEALEVDVLIETTETPESRQFNKILHDDGVKAALRWRKNKMTGTA